MMDFKLILLLVGLGLLLMVILYAIWGFFGGLKRELKCTAVLLILLLLGWLIFSDPAVMMNVKLSAPITSLLSSLELGVSEGAATVWEVVLQVLRAQVPDGEALFIEGREAYELAYDLVAGVLRGVGLMVITIFMIFLSGLIRFVSHIVKLIVTGVKKRKAKKAGIVPSEPEVTHSEDDGVLVLKGVECADDVTVTTSENDLPAPKKIKQHIWGAVVGAIKACVVICILFVPISGVVSVISEVSDETHQLANDAMNGNLQMSTEESETVVDVIFDFVEAYKSSAAGTFVESSSYFFGESFSTYMFNEVFKISTDTQTIYLREELITFIHAINDLEGDVNYKDLDQTKLEAALDELKDSKLLPEIVPVAIEYAYEMDNVNELLTNAGQEALFLQLRYVNWDKDIETLLDAVKVIYQLDLFAEDFNFLTLDVAKVREIVETLGKTEFLPKALPIATQVALKIDAVKNLVQDSSFKPVLTEVDWTQDLNKLVDIYELFQELELTSLEGLDKDRILSLVFNEGHEKTVEDILAVLTEMDVFVNLVSPVAQKIVDAQLASLQEGKFAELSGVLPIADLTKEEWQEDISAIFELADKLYDLNVFSFNLKEMDITSPKAIQTFKEAIDALLGTQTTEGLNILNKNNTLTKVVVAVLNTADLVNEDVNLNNLLKDVVWTKEGEVFKGLVDVYDKLNQYEQFDIQTNTYDFLELLEEEGVGELLTVTLECLVESDLVMNLLPEVLSHKVTPTISDTEMSDILNDILDNVSSEEIVNEIKILVEAVFSAKDLGLFKVPQNGLGAIDFAKTEEMKTLINALCDSKLIDGYEARILRVILKVMKFDVAVELLDVDYDYEQQLLNDFIDALAPVLQNPTFKLVDENGKLVIDLDFLTRTDIASHLINAVQVLFGDYSVESTESQLATNLLHDVYVQIVQDKLPAEYAELFEILAIEEFTNEELAHDLSAVVYVADELVALGIQKLISNQPVEINFNETGYHVENALKALFATNILKANTSELVAWGINFVVDSYNKKATDPIEVSVTANDFVDVDWDREVDTLVNIIDEALNVLETLQLRTSDEIIDFVNSKEYMSEEVLSKENLNAVVDVYEQAARLQILPVIGEIMIDAFIGKINSALPIDVSYLADLSNEQLQNDLIKLTPILRKVVELGAGEYLATKDIQTIDFEIIASLLSDEEFGADLFSLNVISAEPTQLFVQLINFAVEKVAPKLDFTLSVTEVLMAKVNWENDMAHLADVVLVLGETITDLGLESLSDIMDYFKGMSKDKLLSEEILNDANVERVAQILTSVGSLEILEVVLPKLVDAVVLGEDVAAKIDLTFLAGSVTGQELSQDIRSLANLAPIAIELKLPAFALGKLPTGFSSEKVAELVKVVLDLNIVNNNNAEIVKLAVEKVAPLVEKSVNGLTVEYDQSAIDAFTSEIWEKDHENFAKAVGELVSFVYELGIYNADSLNSFIERGEFKELSFYDNKFLVNDVASILSTLLRVETLGELLPSFIEFGIAQISNVQAIDADFTYISEGYRSGSLTNEMLAEDINTIAYMATTLIEDSNIIDLLQKILNKDYENATLNFDLYALAVTKLGNLNVLNFSSMKTAVALVDLVASLAKLDYRANSWLFVPMSQKDWAADAAHLTDLVRKVQDVLDVLEVSTIADIQDLAKNIKDLEQIKELTQDEVLDEVVELLQMVFEFNAGERLVTDIVNYAVDKVAGKVDVSFIKDNVKQDMLHDDLVVIVEIVKEAIQFGAFEILETKDLQDIDLSHVARVVELIPEIKTYAVARENWLVLISSLVAGAVKMDVELEVGDFAGVDLDADNAKLREVIMLIDELLEVNEHDSFTEVKKFLTEGGYLAEQWAHEANAVRVLEILSTLSDVKALFVVANELVDDLADMLIKSGIDVSFLKYNGYTPEYMSSDIKTIVNMAYELIDFDIFDLIWDHRIEEIDVSHLSNIVKSMEDLYIFTLNRDEMVELIAEQLGKALNIPVDLVVTELVNDFSEVDWERENALVCELIELVGELLTDNHLTSTDLLLQFVSDKAYTSVQFIKEENVLYIARALEIVSELKVLEQLLPAVVEFATSKISGLDLSGVDYTAVEPQLLSSDIATLAYIIREAVEFGALEIYENLMWNEKLFLQRDIDLSHVKNILNAFDNINIIAAAEPQWISFVMGMALKAINVNVENSDYASFDLHAEIVRLVSAVDQVEDLLDCIHVVKLADLYSFINEKGYQSAQFITDANIVKVTELVDTFLGLQLLAPIADQLFDFAIANVSQVSFLKGNLTSEQVLSDALDLMSIVRDVVGFGVIDLYYYGTCDFFDMSYVRSIVETLTRLNAVNVERAELTSMLVNLLGNALKVEINTTAADFATCDWAAEDANYLAIVDAIENLILDSNIDNTAMLKKFISYNLYEKAQFVNDVTMNDVLDIIAGVANIQIIVPVVDELALFGLSKVQGVDLSFLVNAIESGALTGQDILTDVEKLVEIGHELLAFGLYDMIYSNSYSDLSDAKLDEFSAIFVKFDELTILNRFRPEWSMLAVNTMVKGLGISISDAELAHITDAMWADEINVLSATIVKAYKYANSIGLTDTKAISDLVEDIKAKKLNKGYLIELLQVKDETKVDSLLDVVDAMIESEVATVLAHKALGLAVDKLLVQRGYELEQLVSELTYEQVKADVHTVVSALRDFNAFGLVDLVLEKGAIPYENIEVLYNGLEKLFNTNLLNVNSDYLLNGLLKDLYAYDDSSLRLSAQYADVETIIDQLIVILKNQNITTVQQILDLKSSGKLVINTEFNKVLTSVANILEVLSKEFFSQAILSAAEGYASSFLDKYAGLTDIYNIYNKVTLGEDLENLVNVINALKDIDIYRVLDNYKPIPYTDFDSVETILNNLLGLHYLNDSGRTDEIVASLGSILNMSLSSYNIDYVGDAAKLLEMYKNLAKLTQRADYPYVYVRDFKTNKLSLSFFMNKEVLRDIYRAFLNLQSTTIYSETGGVILVALLPVVKRVAPEYYEALDIEDLSGEQIAADGQTIIDIIDTIISSDILSVLKDQNSPINRYNVVNDLQSLTDKVFDLNIASNTRLTRVAELLLRDLVYGKTILGQTIPNKAFSLTLVNWKNDANLLVDIVDQVLVILENEAFTTVNEIQAIKVSKELVKSIITKDANLQAIENIVNYASDIKLLATNAAKVKTYFVDPMLEKANLAKYVPYEGATNAQLVSDIKSLATVIGLVRQLGVCDIINGATINYDQADIVEAILTEIANTHYVAIHKQLIFNKLSSMLEGLNVYGATVSDVTLREDIIALADVYATIIPVLTSAEYPFATIDDYKVLDKEELMAVINLLLDNLDVVGNAVSEINDISLVPYALVDVYNKLFSNASLRSVLQYVNPTELTVAQLHADIERIANILRAVKDGEIHLAVIEQVGKMTFAIESNTQFDEVAITEIIDNAYALEILKGDYANILNNLLRGMGFDVSYMDLYGIDYDNEVVALKELVVKGKEILEAMGIKTLQGVINEYRHVMNLSVEGNSLIRKVAKYLVEEVKGVVAVEQMVEVVEIIAKSSLVDNLVVPVYDKYLSSKLPALGSLATYTPVLVAEDMDRIATIARDIVDSEIYRQLAYKATIPATSIPAVQDIITNFFALNILNLKANELLALVDAYLPLDLSSIDLSDNDFIADGEAIATLVPELYEIYLRSNYFKLAGYMLGDTELWQYISSVYDQLISIETTHDFALWALREVAMKQIDKLYNNYYSQADQILVDLSGVLEGLLELGVFSNDYIDLTNSAAIDKVVNSLFNTIHIGGTKQQLVNYFVAHVSEFGLVPVNYSDVYIVDEINNMKSIYNEVMAVLNNYGSAISSKDISALLTEDFKARAHSLVTLAYNSHIIDGMIPQLAKGALACVTGIRTDKLAGYVESDYHAIIDSGFVLAGYLDTLGLFERNIVLSDTTTMKAAINHFVNDPYFYELCDKIARYIVKRIGGSLDVIDFNAIDYHAEAAVVCDFLDFAQEALSLPGISISNLSSMMTTEFIVKVAPALKVLDESVLFRTYIREAELKAAGKLTISNDLIDLVISELHDSSSYTNAEIVADWDNLVDLAKALATLGVLDGSIDMTKKAEVITVINKAFELNVIEGHEDVVVETILSYVDFISVTIDYTGIDWAVEKPLFVEFVESICDLIAHPGLDINALSASDLQDTAIQALIVNIADKASVSSIGAQILPEVYASKIEQALPEDYRGIIDFNDPTFTNDKWADEFQKLFDLYNELESMNFTSSSFDPTFAQILSVFDKAFGLNGVHAIKQNYKHWLTKFVSPSNLPTIGGFVVEYKAANDTNAAWGDEVTAIKHVLEALATFASATDTVKTMNFEKVYSSQDWARLESALLAISNSYSMRGLLVELVNYKFYSVVNSSSDFDINDYKSAAFTSQVTNGYDEAFWTDAEIRILAQFVCVINYSVYDYVNGMYDSSKIGLEMDYGTVTATNVNYGQDNFTVENTGLLHILQLMNHSSIFDINGLTETIKDFLSSKLIVEDTSVIASMSTNVEENDAIILDLVNMLKVFKANDLMGPDASTKLASMISDDTKDAVTTSILNSVNNCSIVRGIIRELLRKSIESYIVSKYSVTESQAETIARTALQTANPGIYSQLYDGAEMADVATWAGYINVLPSVVRGL